MKSSENYRGTNCVDCHIAPEGEVLGVIRLEFNLNHLTQMVNHRTLIAVGIMSVIALFGFMLTLFSCVELSFSLCKNVGIYV